MDAMEPIMMEGGAAVMEEEPMMMEMMEGEPAEKKVIEKVCTALAVLASQEDDVQLFDKITSSAAFLENEEA